MPKMVLQELKLTNFKGIKDFTFSPCGKSASVYAANGLGKTTLLDGWLWLLFSKDSLNQANFDIKPLDADGKVISGLESIVEATIDIDGEELTLKKSYQEKYTKKRGSAQSELTGHGIKYWIDGVPVKQGEYQDRIRSIVDEKLFRTLSDVKFFNESLKWEERRRILLDVCGDVSDTEVISSSKELERLPVIIGKRTLDEYRKIASSRKTEINKQIAEIPPRIDEANKSKADVGAATKVGISTELAALTAQKKAKEEELLRTRDGGEIADKTKRLREIEAKIQELQNRERTAIDDAERAQRLRIQQLSDERDAERKKIDHLIRRRSDACLTIGELENEIETQRSEWYRINENPFNQDGICPTCGQEYPQEYKNKTLAAFNESKASTLSEINRLGKECNEAILKNRDLIAQVDFSIEEPKKKIADIEEQIKKEEAKPTSTPNIDPVFIEMKRQKFNLECSIQELQTGASTSLQPLQLDISWLENQITEKQNILAQIDSNYRSEARIRELMKQEKELASEYEKLEGELFLCDLFIRTKVSMLDERINSKFAFCRFKLFSENINGGIEPTCITTINGVPYNSANEASRINSGIAIASVLANHHGLYLPQWIDGCESVCEVLHSKPQQIKLIVSKDHERLTVYGEGEYPPSAILDDTTMKALEKLTALEAAGVDNWEGYNEAIYCERFLGR
jgi:hypothetical protein